MSRMYSENKDKGLVVMGFPCNQFGAQEPKSEAEIKKFAEKYDVAFPMFSKVDVKGDSTHPVYKFLLACLPGDITWNFSVKFLVDKTGVPVARFDKDVGWDAIEKHVVAALSGSSKM